MVNFKVEISKLIAEQVADLTAEEIQSMIEVPQDTKMGDYAFPCFKLAKTLRKAPPLIAAGIAEAISGNEMFEKVELDKQDRKLLGLEPEKSRKRK